MPKKDKPPAPLVRLDRGRLTPVTAWDAELLAAYPAGAIFDLKHRTRRSNAHQGMYWAQLSAIVKATEAWATAEKMHEWIKLRLGYTSPVFGPSGDVIGMTIDSTAFDEMDQPAFNVFYEKFAALVAAEMGIDLDNVK